MNARFKDDPNFLMLLHVADALGDLREELVFLGMAENRGIVRAFSSIT